MKYRILTLTDGAGDKTYVPQYKSWLRWKHFRTGYDGCGKAEFYHEEAAVAYIERQKVHALRDKVQVTAVKEIP